MPRLYNFSAGPCTLPLEVLEEVRDNFVDYHGQGMSIVEMSHRTPPVEDVMGNATGLVRELMGLPEDYHVLILAGGATFQFGMIPLNLLHVAPGSRATGQEPKAADYTNSGAWAKKAIADAKAMGGKVNVIFDGKPSNFTTLPDPASLKVSDDATYLHLTSNETIGGLQWKAFPEDGACGGVPIVADMSSDFLSRDVPVERFGLIYAGAQKNVAPAGATILIVRDDVLAMCPNTLPGYLNYAGHVEGGSMLNTPPVFQVWMMSLVLKWLKDQGGLSWAAEMAAKRSGLLYDAIANAGGGSGGGTSGGGFYSCPVDERYRSTMNVVFRLPTDDLEERFVAEATAAGMDGLKGHRSVGGIRASVYNAMPLAGAERLAGFMGEFAAKHG